MNHRCELGVLAMGLWLSAGQALHAQQAVSATFGDVIQVQGGTPSDIVLDELRHQLYLVSNTTSQVLVFDYTSNQVVAKIAVGRTPLAGAMSMDGNLLYVTASGPPSALYAIDLTANRLAYSQTLPSTPQGVETGIDGRVLVAMVGTGVTSGVPQKTLQMFDPVAPDPDRRCRAGAGHHPGAASGPGDGPAGDDLPRQAAAHSGRAVHCRSDHADRRQHLHFRLRSGFGRDSAQPHDRGTEHGDFDGAGRLALHGRHSPCTTRPRWR